MDYLKLRRKLVQDDILRICKVLKLYVSEMHGIEISFEVNLKKNLKLIMFQFQY